MTLGKRSASVFAKVKNTCTVLNRISINFLETYLKKTGNRNLLSYCHTGSRQRISITPNRKRLLTNYYVRANERHVSLLPTNG